MQAIKASLVDAGEGAAPEPSASAKSGAPPPGQPALANGTHEQVKVRFTPPCSPWACCQDLRILLISSQCLPKEATRQLDSPPLHTAPISRYARSRLGSAPSRCCLSLHCKAPQSGTFCPRLVSSPTSPQETCEMQGVSVLASSLPCDACRAARLARRRGLHLGCIWTAMALREEAELAAMTASVSPRCWPR